MRGNKMIIEGWEEYGIDEGWVQDFERIMTTNFKNTCYYKKESENIYLYKGNFMFLVSNNGGELNVSYINHLEMVSVPYCGRNKTLWNKKPIEMAIKVVETFRAIIEGEYKLSHEDSKHISDFLDFTRNRYEIRNEGT